MINLSRIAQTIVAENGNLVVHPSDHYRLGRSLLGRQNPRRSRPYQQALSFDWIRSSFRASRQATQNKAHPRRRSITYSVAITDDIILSNEHTISTVAQNGKIVSHSYHLHKIEKDGIRTHAVAHYGFHWVPKRSTLTTRSPSHQSLIVIT